MEDRQPLRYRYVEYGPLKSHYRQNESVRTIFYICPKSSKIQNLSKIHNRLKWAKLGSEAWHEWLTPAMLYAFTGEYIFGEAGTMCGKFSILCRFGDNLKSKERPTVKERDQQSKRETNSHKQRPTVNLLE